MKRLLTAALASVAGLAMAASAFATDTRINSLSASGALPGGVFDEKTITIHDTANIYPLPQYLAPSARVNYGNSVDVDATNAKTFGTMNVRYALSDDATLLLYGKGKAWQPVTSTQTIGGANAAGAAGFSAHNGLEATDHQFGIGFGMRASETMRLGATLGIGGRRNDAGAIAPINLNSNTSIDLTAGLGLDLSEVNSLDFALNLNIGMFTNQELVQSLQDRYMSDGLFGLSLLAKGEFQVHQIAKMVPYLRFGYDGRGVAHFARPDEQGSGNDAKRAHLTNIGLNLGSDLAISPVEGVLIQPGLGISFRSSTLTGNSAAGQPPPPEADIEKSSQWVPFYGFAAEAKAFDWLVLRLGARQAIVNENYNNTQPQAQPGQPQNSNERHTTATNIDVTTGVGIQMMGWNLDLCVNPAFFNNGIYAVSGTATAFATDFALSYDW